MKSVYGAVYIAFLLTAGLSLSSAPALAGPTPCFDVRVEYRGREYVSTVGIVQYFRWTYRVSGQGCINRGLSHWTLQLCAEALAQSDGTSTQCVDASDAPNGTVTNYSPVRGLDPTTGITGVKWNCVAGNPVNKPNEYDDFSFIASGTVTPVTWAAKSAQIVVSGTTLGPSCAPVPVENATWSSIKATYRR